MTEDILKCCECGEVFYGDEEDKFLPVCPECGSCEYDYKITCAACKRETWGVGGLCSDCTKEFGTPFCFGTPKGWVEVENTCEKCGEKFPMYQVKKAVWGEAFTNNKGLICERCLEKIVGHSFKALHDEDFFDVGYYRE